jgi:SET domain-containing protein
MLLVKTKIGSSLIHGIGLFADQFIPANTIVWRHNDLIDRVYRYDQLEHMPNIIQDILNNYGWRENEYLVMPGDNARFTNHSLAPNCETAPGISYALYDIQVGEEITEDYSSFYHNAYIPV